MVLEVLPPGTARHGGGIRSGDGWRSGEEGRISLRYSHRTPTAAAHRLRRRPALLLSPDAAVSCLWRAVAPPPNPLARPAPPSLDHRRPPPPSSAARNSKRARPTLLPSHGAAAAAAAAAADGEQHQASHPVVEAHIAPLLGAALPPPLGAPSPAGTTRTFCSPACSRRRALALGRKIPRSPYKVMDAPALQNDFYLNLVDWSLHNVLTVGLGNCVYLWNACSSKYQSSVCSLQENR